MQFNINKREAIIKREAKLKKNVLIFIVAFDIVTASIKLSSSKK